MGVAWSHKVFIILLMFCSVFDDSVSKVHSFDGPRYDFHRRINKQGTIWCFARRNGPEFGEEESGCWQCGFAKGEKAQKG
jgi:hypothetical protein